MKKLLVIFLTLALSLSFIMSVSALSPSDITLDYSLSCDGENVISKKPGDIITVTYALKNITDGTAYNISSIANEIYYDHTFFEYVEGSATVTSGLNQSAALRVYSNGEHRVFFNGYEIPAKEYSAEQIIGTFQLKIIASSGSSTIGSRGMLASSSGVYKSMTTDLVVRIGDAPIIPVYSLDFETNGGTAIFTVKKNEGTVVDLSVFKPIRDGYTFGGWYSDAELTTPVTSITLNGNTTVYAKWNKLIPNLPYVGENGSWWIGNTDTGIASVYEGLYYIPYVSTDGHWHINGTDTGINAQGIEPPQVEVKQAVVNGDGELVITLVDGRVVNAGQLENFDIKAKGVSVSSVKVEKNELIVGFTDGTVINAGSLEAANGFESFYERYALYIWVIIILIIVFAVYILL